MQESEVDQLIAGLKAVAHPTRLAILVWLQDPHSFPAQDRPALEVGVCLKHIQARAGVSQSTASQFMATLQRAGLVRCNRVGQWSHYERDEQAIARLESTFGRMVGSSDGVHRGVDAGDDGVATTAEDGKVATHRGSNA